MTRTARKKKREAGRVLKWMFFALLVPIDTFQGQISLTSIRASNRVFIGDIVNNLFIKKSINRILLDINHVTGNARSLALLIPLFQALVMCIT